MNEAKMSAYRKLSAGLIAGQGTYENGRHQYSLLTELIKNETIYERKMILNALRSLYLNYKRDAAYTLISCLIQLEFKQGVSQD